jgi:hypothetical protein
MNDYIIGSGAILVPGPEGFMTPATLHAQADPLLAGVVQAAAFDFEGSETSLQRLLVVAAGWTAGAFERRIAARLRARGEASLADVLAMLAAEVGTRVVHVFARWLPDQTTLEAASRLGVTIVAHPLEAVERVSLVSGTRRLKWGPARAA